MNRTQRIGLTLAAWTLAAVSMAQAPDLTNALDPGSASSGAGGAFGATNANTLSSYLNPAGLGYISGTLFGISYRNLPSSTTSITGTYTDPRRSTDGQMGQSRISHVGWALPFSRIKRGAAGTLAVSYTVGGFIDDIGTGPSGGLPDGTGAFTINGFTEHKKAKADFYTVAYGKTNAAQNLAFGLGLVYVQQQITFSQSGDSGGVGFTPFDLSSTGNGFGVIGGVQYVPPKSPNVSFGLSVRSPIDLTNNQETAPIYDRVPGRILAGTAIRRDGLRGGKDFAVLGLQIESFFGGKSSLAFDRNGQTTAGVGLEYSYQLGSARLPLRVGYSAVPSGGDAFGDRNTMTYGIGYRPNDSNYGVDLSWGSSNGGGKDFVIAATYRFH